MRPATSWFAPTGAAAAPATASSLFGANTSATSGGLFGAPAPAGAITGSSLFGATPFAGTATASAPAPGAELQLNALFEKLPQPSREWLLSTEKRINEWGRAAERFSANDGEMEAAQRVLIETQRQAELLAEQISRDEKLLLSFKSQVDQTLVDAHQAEREFSRRHDQAYGRSVTLPSPFFDVKLKALQDETHGLQAHTIQLEGAVAPNASAITAETLNELLLQHKDLFERCAVRLQSQHARMETHRYKLKHELGQDLLGEARLRQQAVRDKYKPSEQAAPVYPIPTFAADPAAPASAAPAPALSLFGPTPTAPNPFALQPAAAPAPTSLFGAPTATGAFGSAPAVPASNPFASMGTSTPATPAGGLFGVTPPAIGSSNSGMLRTSKKKSISSRK
eukprot:CAMPEP_0119350294 /NCGR_PEP_ID=MMETSP1333-20130426/109986_1 /TAXON_ID=418940 /ORGANISM="Scyphosphaera apsteinii, Strain RCC1455" /LENGTH=394 /DNA_ID=CAMNT_0007362909 /DNA_START=1 /DNA_END=1185 /DNA_ORIENTATION=+